MTHWLVKVDKVFQAIKQTTIAIRKAAKDNYDNDKRGFLEGLTNFAIQIPVILMVLFWIVLPIPPIPKQTHFPGIYQFFFVVSKPFLLHCMALFGIMLFLNPRLMVFSLLIHPIFSVIIKIHNYITFVRKTKDAIPQ